MALPRVVTVTLYTSHNTSGEDATNYIVPDYRGQLQAESGLLGYVAGSMDFTILDKGTDKAQRYWSTRILTSTAFNLASGARCPWPVVEVKETEQDASVSPSFWGYIERGSFRWIGDTLSGFSAVTQLSMLEAVEMASAGVGGSYQCAQSTAGSRGGPDNKIWTVATWDTGTGDYVSEGVLPGDVLRIGATSYAITRVVAKNQVQVGTTITTIGSAASHVRRSTLTTYSGHAAPLMRRALRVAGNASPNIDQVTPDPADVLIQDYKLGTTQGDVDWNHVLRQWQSDLTKSPVEANRMSDFVPYVQYGTQLGFICIDGKLYRVDLANSEPTVATRNGIALTQITRATQRAGVAVTSGYRMFPYYLADGTACLCIVQARLHEQQTRTIDNWLSGPTSAGMTAAQAGLDALTVAGKLDPVAGAGIAVGAQVVVGALCGLTSKVNCQNTGTYYWVIKSVDVMSIGDGTNDPATGVGAAFNKTVTPSIHGSLFLQRGEYTLADSVCTNRPATDAASILYFGRYNEGLASTYVTYCHWNGSTWVEGRRAGESIPGLLMGGMAARARGDDIVYLVCSTSNCIYVIAINDTGGRGMAYVTGRGGFSRFVGAVNAVSPTTSVLFTGTIDGTVYKAWIDGNTLKLSPVDITGALPTGFKLVITAQYPLTREPGNVGLPCIYRARDGYGDEYHYLGWLRTVAAAQLELATDLCAYPIPNGNSSDLRPPMLWKDAMSGRDIIRAVVPATTIDGALLATDFYETSLWAVPFQHHNFTAQPITLRSYIESTGRAFNCYVKLMGLTKPATTLERKVFSRFAYAPASVGGTITAGVSVSDQPKLSVEGIEYYLGFESNAMGERIRAGSVTAGTTRHTYMHNGPFITPNWARVMGKWVIASYPATSVGYPVGRRIISAHLYKLVDGSGNEVTPTYKMLFGQALLTAFSAGDILTIITGLGYDKSTNLFDATLLEYSTADLTSTDSAPDSTLTELPLVAEEETTPPGAGIGIGARQLVTWDCRAIPTNTWGTNAKDGPCYYAFTVYLPRGLRLYGYRYQLVSPGLIEHNVSTFEMWIDGGDYPLTPVPGTRAWCLHQGRAVGMHRVGLQDVDFTELLPGLYRIVVGIERQDIGTLKVIEPPMVWQDGITVSPRALGLRPDMSNGIPTIGYITEWDATLDFECQQVPLVYAEGDA